MSIPIRQLGGTILRHYVAGQWLDGSDSWTGPVEIPLQVQRTAYSIQYSVQHTVHIRSPSIHPFKGKEPVSRLDWIRVFLSMCLCASVLLSSICFAVNVCLLSFALSHPFLLPPSPRSSRNQFGMRWAQRSQTRKHGFGPWWRA